MAACPTAPCRRWPGPLGPRAWPAWRAIGGARCRSAGRSLQQAARREADSAEQSAIGVLDLVGPALAVQPGRRVGDEPWVGGPDSPLDSGDDDLGRGLAAG